MKALIATLALALAGPAAARPSAPPAGRAPILQDKPDAGPDAGRPGRPDTGRPAPGDDDEEDRG